jgi:hypothetical protein
VAVERKHDHTIRNVTIFGMILGLALSAVMFWSAMGDRPQRETACRYGMREVQK